MTQGLPAAHDRHSPTDAHAARLLAWRRRRGLSQQALADLAGLSQPYLSQLERGDRQVGRRTQERLAAALQITVAQLLGELGDPLDPHRTEFVADVAPLRLALIEAAAGARRAPTLDLAEVTQRVAEVTALRNAGRWSQVGRLLPDLVREISAHGPAASRLMVAAMFTTRFGLAHLGFGDLARDAAHLGVRAAQDCDDPAHVAFATYSLVQAFPADAAELGLDMTLAAADGLQGYAGDDAAQTYGWLHLLAAQQHALVGDAMRAWVHLDEAADVARHLGEPTVVGEGVAGFQGAWFGPTLVDCHRVSVSAELRAFGDVDALQHRIDLDLLRAPLARCWYFTELARAAVGAGDRDEQALAALLEAESHAPQQFRMARNPTALLSTLMGRMSRRQAPAAMTRMATRLGLGERAAAFVWMLCGELALRL